MGNESVPEPEELQAFGVGVRAAVADGDVKDTDAGAAKILHARLAVLARVLLVGLHRREEARFRLTLENDADAALGLARDNWAVQREPADLRILIEAARATRNADALKIAADWIAANRLEDVTTVAVLGSRR